MITLRAAFTTRKAALLFFFIIIFLRPVSQIGGCINISLLLGCSSGFLFVRSGGKVCEKHTLHIGNLCGVCFFVFVQHRTIDDCKKLRGFFPPSFLFMLLEAQEVCASLPLFHVCFTPPSQSLRSRCYLQFHLSTGLAARR